MTREAEVAWAAGLFEGEGCISVYERPDSRATGPQTRLSLNSTDLDVVERFGNVIGEGNVTGPARRRRRPHHKLIWNWHAESAVAVIRALRLLKPYLGERRSAKAEEALTTAWERVVRRLVKHSEETPRGVKVSAAAWAQLTAALGEE